MAKVICIDADDNRTDVELVYTGRLFLSTGHR
jgi:hypothetical protein